MRRSIHSTLKLITRVAFITLAISVLTVGLATTTLWLTSEAANIVSFLNTLDCGPYSSDSQSFTVLCTLGNQDNTHLRFVCTHAMTSFLSKLATAPQKLRLLEAGCSSSAPAYDEQFPYAKCKAAFTIDEYLALITAPAVWIPSRLNAVVWSLAILLSSAIVLWSCRRIRNVKRDGKAAVGTPINGQSAGSYIDADVWELNEWASRSDASSARESSVDENGIAYMLAGERERPQLMPSRVFV
jgi:hypothetical protein